jgi:hypothetical protein
MLPRRGRWGLFWGCVAFETTGCKFTRRAAPKALDGYAILEMETCDTFRLHLSPHAIPATDPSSRRASDDGGGGGGSTGAEQPLMRLQRLLTTAGLTPLRVDRRADGVTGAVFPLDTHSAVRSRLAAAAPRLPLLPVPASTIRYFQRRRPPPLLEEQAAHAGPAQSGSGGGAGGGAGAAAGSGRWWMELLPEEMRRSLLPFQAPAARPQPPGSAYAAAATAAAATAPAV